MSRVALIFERFDGFQPILEALTARCEKLGIEYLRLLLESSGHQVELIDNQLEQIPSDSLAERLNQSGFEIIGLSLNSGNLQSSLSLAGKLTPGPLVTLGGVGASLHADEILQEHPRVDGVILGEGEAPILELASWADQGGSRIPSASSFVTRRTPSPPLAGAFNLDLLPQFAHPNLHRYEQATISTSRGCRYACAYCAESRFLRQAGVRWHARSSSRVLDELAFLVRSKGVSTVWIVDGDFIGRSPERVSEICEGIRREKLDFSFEIDARADDIDEELFDLLAQCGLRRVFIGVESLSERLLASMRKRVRLAEVHHALEVLSRLGIKFTLGMIPFTEETTYEELAADVAFMHQQGFENIGSHIFAGMKDYSRLNPRMPSRFADERVAEIFREGNNYERRLGLCYASRVKGQLSIADRQNLVSEISNYIGNELLSLVQKYA